MYLHIVLSDAAAYHAATLETMWDQYTPNVRSRLEMGRHDPPLSRLRALAQALKVDVSELVK